MKDRCNVLCERMDNEASGSREELAVTLIKYNKKNIKTTVSNTKNSNTKNRNTKNKVKKIQSYIYKFCQIFFREARLETRNRLGLNI